MLLVSIRPVWIRGRTLKCLSPRPCRPRHWYELTGHALDFLEVLDNRSGWTAARRTVYMHT